MDIYNSDKSVDEIIIPRVIAQEAIVNDAAEQQNMNDDEVVEEAVSVEQIKEMTDEEIDILKRLAERRRRLNEWEDELQVRYNVLSITEEKIDKKLEELRDLKKRVDDALIQYQQEEDKKARSLVKIYENMKPKEAADIMSRMRIENILPIISIMKEKSAAGILAKMDPSKAKDITSRLTEVGRLKN
jgi:flagellar motility protein MotE (MotC chaperone)